MKIYSKVRGGYVRVFVGSEEVKAFSLLAEDYAITLANKYVAKLKNKREKDV